MIEIVNLSKNFGSLWAVKNLNLTVNPGEIFGFLGPNGAGKTTTIRLLVGLLRPATGTAAIAGHDIQQDALAAKRSFGYLAQPPLLYERLTGREFLHFIGGIYGLTDRESEERAQDLLTVMDLGEKADQLIESYSGGMRHKIGLCAALLHQPGVLILDEPLAGLDPASSRRIKDALLDLRASSTTIFLSTHMLETAEHLCDRVGILDRGQLIAVGTVAELQAAARSRADTSLESLFLQLTQDET
jgi:ABC-2 type transport system ATP-binding protein